MSALLTLFEEGETSFQNQDVFEGMVNLARALGVDIKDADMSRCERIEGVSFIMDLEVSQKDANISRCDGDTSSMLLVDEEEPDSLEMEQKPIPLTKPRRTMMIKQLQSMKARLYPESCRQTKNNDEDVNESSSILLEEEDEHNILELEEDSTTLPKPRQSVIRKQQQTMEPLLFPKSCSRIESSEIGSFECSSCPQVFKSQNKLKFHAMCHPSFNCNICGKEFRFPSLLNKHMVSCQEEPLYINVVNVNKGNIVDPLLDNEFYIQESVLL